MNPDNKKNVALEALLWMVDYDWNGEKCHAFVTASYEMEGLQLVADALINEGRRYVSSMSIRRVNVGKHGTVHLLGK